VLFLGSGVERDINMRIKGIAFAKVRFGVESDLPMELGSRFYLSRCCDDDFLKRLVFGILLALVPSCETAVGVGHSFEHGTIKGFHDDGIVQEQLDFDTRSWFASDSVEYMACDPGTRVGHCRV